MSIYISNNLYLTGGNGYNSNNPIIHYHSMLLPEYITATESSVRPAINAWTPDTALVWEGEAYSGVSATLIQYLELSNPNNEQIDCISFGRHNFYTGGYIWTIQSSIDDGDTWDNVTAPTTSNSNDAIISYFNSRSHGLFRIKIEKTGTSISAPIIGHVKMGRALILQRRIYVGHQPATLARNVKKTSLGSENGQYLGQVVHRSYYTTSINQENNSPAFVRANIVPFINHVNGHVEVNDTAPATFFFAWRPGDYPDEVVYGWTSDNIQPENQGSDSMGGRMSWSCSVEAIV